MKKIILVVDDSRLNLVIARDLLSEEYDVQTVDSGEGAFQFLLLKLMNF